MVGRTVSHYRLLEPLGRGGMGVVYKAEDTKLERLVALKFLPPELIRDDEAKARFIREAQAVSALDHPNICTIYEIDEAPDGQLFLVMACYEGETLTQKIGRGPLPVDEALDITIHVARGLQRAHAKGIVHRDIKPANIIITTEGVVKVVDFGIAKLGDLTRLTRPGSVLGTVAYMSPEQIRGEDVDPRADLWSTGVLLYEMLTGQLPFDGPHNQAVVQAILGRSPVPPSELLPAIPVKVEQATLRCLQKDRQHRFATMRELEVELAGLRSGPMPAVTAAVSGQAGAAPAGAITERRSATVVCVKFQCGTAGRKGMASEAEGSSLSQRCLEIAQEVELAYQGSLCWMGLNTFQLSFGAPGPVEHAPTRAVHAALEIRNHVRRHNGQHADCPPVAVRIGVSTGLVITGSTRGELHPNGFVIGPAADVAAALVDVCVDDQIVVAPETQRQTAASFRYSSPVRHQLPGREQALQVFELVAARTGALRTGVAGERGIESAVVGRAREMDRLRLQLFRVLNGAGSIVSIIGDAGIGKSRLIAELTQQPEVERVTLLRGRATSIGKQLSFHPVIDLIKVWAKIAEDDDGAAAFSKLERAVVRVQPEEAGEIVPFVGRLLGLTLPAAHAERLRGIESQALEKLILMGVRRLVAAAAERRPLVIIIDDLHWADTSTLELVKSLLRLASDHAVLFVNIFRPGYEETSERLLNHIRAAHQDLHAEIRLEPLTPDQAGLLITNLLKAGQLPSELSDAIVEKAAGNPYFVEEIIRSLIDAGAVTQTSGRFKLMRPVDEVVIPDTISEILLSRVDRLEPRTHALLQTASVVGQHFFRRVLAAVVGPMDDLDDRLRQLESVQMLVRRANPDEVEYQFKHAIAHETIYQAIVHRQRADLHLKIAQVLEELFASRLHDVFGMLAYHYSRGENLDKAYEYLTKAGEEALKASASSEALEYYTHALRVYLNLVQSAADPAKVATLEKNIALAYYNRGLYPDAIEHFDRVHAHLWKIPTRPYARAARFAVSLAHMIVGLYWPAVRWRRDPPPKVAEIINVFYYKLLAMGHTDAKRVFVESMFLIGKVLPFDLRKVQNGPAIFAGASLAFSWTGMSFTLSRKILDFVQDKIDPTDARSLVYCRTNRLTLDFFSGRWNTEPFDHEIVSRGMRIAEIFSISNFTIYSGRMAVEQGRFDAAATALAKLEEIGAALEFEYPIALKHFLTSKVLMKRRLIEEGLKASEEGLAFKESTRLGTLMLGLYSIRARLMVLAGDVEAAEAMLARAAAVKARMNVAPCYLSEFLLASLAVEIHRAGAALAAGKATEARTCLKQAMSTAAATVRNSRKVASDQVEALRLLGCCYALEGSRRRAERAWRRSRAAGERLGARLELARTEAEIGRHLLRSPGATGTLDGLNGRQHIDRARTMFREMGLEWELEALERLGPEAGV